MRRALWRALRYDFVSTKNIRTHERSDVFSIKNFLTFSAYEFDEDSDAVKAKELHRAIENNNIKAAAYSIKGKSATPLYKTVDLGIDGKDLQ